jgi:DNA-binding LacI/PurR family transcriptional regulator
LNIYQIAQIGKVSPSTVSKVINGKGHISEETRKRVLDIVAKNNYQPRSGNHISGNTAIFYRKPQSNMFSVSYFNLLLSCISERFDNKDRNLILISTDKIPTDKNQFQMYCQCNRIESAVFLNLKMQDNFVENTPVLFLLSLYTVNLAVKR